ncbi:MAG TPA: APC family permease [Anaerolineales bacterium]|nr:APC family permease [Anaerolineales bacterium]
MEATEASTEAESQNNATENTTVETSTNIIRRNTPDGFMRHWKTWVVGRPLRTADAPHQTIGKAVGLAVFASDALSSTAYATQEILVILAAAGMGAFGYAFPISLAIVTLLTIVTISYEQTIHAYPGGGGAYIVARDNLGELPAQTAGAALLMDYILTVSVSISSGIAQIVSAYPELFPYRVAIAVIMVGLIAWINLRGVRESGSVFAIPTYFFLATMVITLLTAFFRLFTGTLGTVVDPPHMHQEVMTGISLFLILHAFASGTTALTGVEAISNGITAFKEPRSHNAGITLIWMSAILGFLFLGITYLSGQIGAIPSEEETVISQLARTAFGGRNIFYLILVGGTTVILIMAANTAFADFPRLGALHAGDGFLPRQLTYKGSRLVYSRGVMTLAVIASVLIVLFQASVTRLIPLYAIGVFLSFTLSQAGMAVRWNKIGKLKPGEEIHEAGSVLRHDPKWRGKMLVNGFGALCTAIVMVIFAVTKFTEGAWVILLLIPILVTIFFRIHHHYKNLARSLTLENYSQPDGEKMKQKVLILISTVHRGTLAAVRYARSLSDDITAVHVGLNPEDYQKVEDKWKIWGEGLPLVILESPYRQLYTPILSYIKELETQKSPNVIITVVIPEFITRRWWEKWLHWHTADLLRRLFVEQPGVVIVEVPYQV